MKGYKTVVFAGFLAGISALSTDEMRTFLVDNLGISGSVVGAVVVYLRWMTTTPIFKKDET